MTEQDWLACTDPEKMLEFEKQLPLGSARKQRLFACACCRQAGDLIVDGRCWEAIEVAERYADDLADADDIVWAFQVAHEIAGEQRKAQGDGAALAADLASAACEESSEMAYYAWLYLLDLTPKDMQAVRRAWGKRIVLCIWGLLPFHLVTIDPGWLTPTVMRLVEAIYEDRAFDRMPGLADALEESGCTNPDILNHCRQPGEHVRGCWVVDALLGKQ